MRHHSLLALSILCSSVTLMPVFTEWIFAEEPPSQPLISDKPVSGLVTAVIGNPTAVNGSVSSTARALHLGDLVQAGEEVRSGQAGSVEILWDRRALLTLQDDARVVISENNRGQTHAQVKHGTVRVALSYGAGRMTDVFSLDTPQAHVVARGGIMEANVVGSEQRSLFAKLVQSGPSESLRVLEGQARVEPISALEKPFAIKAGSEVAMRGGLRISSSEFHADRQASPSLAVREEHRALAAPVVKQIVSAQVGRVLELEKSLAQKPQGNETEQLGSSLKGAIVSTSLGVPAFLGSPASSAAAGATAASFTVTAAPTAPVAPPVTPVPPSVGITSPSQSGGLNTSALLQQIVNSVVGNQGKGNGKGPKNK
ncbi:MAG TPA: hypothetical protein VFQ34_06975 [Nitrospiraceae bacterium]|nr:hypothetical protein [Nitrospiraceae bacterium]